MVLGVILLILAAAGIAKYLSGGDSEEDNNQAEDYTYPRYEPRLGSSSSSGIYPRNYRFDKETGRFDED